MSARKLRAEAHRACERRGHDMTNLYPVARSADKPVAWGARCKRCNAWVNVRLNPAPNEVDIGGSAVAVNCPEDLVYVVHDNERTGQVESYGPFCDSLDAADWARLNDIMQDHAPHSATRRFSMNPHIWLADAAPIGIFHEVRP